MLFCPSNIDKILSFEQFLTAFQNIIINSVQFSSVTQSSPTVVTPWTAASQASLSITNSCSLLKLMSIESVIPSSHLNLCHPLLLLPPIPPRIRVFSNESTLCMKCQSTGVSASASVLPMNIQGWFPFGLIGLISLLSKGLSRVFSSTTVQKHQLFSVSLLYGSTLTSIHDYWKNHSFGYIDLCQQSDVSAF